MGAELRDLPRRLLGFANVCAALAASVFAVALFVSPDSFSQALPAGAGPAEFELHTDVRSRPGTQLAALVGFLLLVWNVLYLLYRRRSPPSPDSHVVTAGNGSGVRVSCEAIEHELRSAGERLPGISKARIVVRSTGRRRVDVRAQFESPDETPIQAASQQLRATLTRRFDELVGGGGAGRGNKVDYAIEFVGFSGPSVEETSPATGLAAQEAAGASFTGPKYPVDDDPRGEKSR